MSLSKSHPSIGVYIAENSNFCPVLATGLSGLYSLLPRKLLTEVMTANGLASAHQRGHQSRIRLLSNSCSSTSHRDFSSRSLVRHFIRTSCSFRSKCSKRTRNFSNTIEEIIATTAYLELCIRTVTEPDLLQVFLKFIFTEKFDGQRILDTLTTRIACYKKLSLVTIVLFKTLLDLNCEDVMTELVFKHLLSLDFLSEHTNQQLHSGVGRLDQALRRQLQEIQNRFTNRQEEKENNSNANNCNNCLNNMASDLPCEEHHFDKNFDQEAQFVGSFLSQFVQQTRKLSAQRY
ncbi:hypothetical protein L1887_63343 [Cichorium endivia]|nr:hypothetical protein L1887_63343 [Cichorium endivia]